MNIMELSNQKELNKIHSSTKEQILKVMDELIKQVIENAVIENVNKVELNKK